MIWEYAGLTCAYTLTKEVACPVEYTPATEMQISACKPRLTHLQSDTPFDGTVYFGEVKPLPGPGLYLPCLLDLARKEYKLHTILTAALKLKDFYDSLSPTMARR